ncbi:DNA polymerase III subunit delta [Neobittarella massiliensis]|uniref:DNA-directed DNA polymerase n=1 Tax=Neobittarella massiliensis (ex Bilen et al. 2018) TaxID=2041842 RepID=A0A8J6IL81_9FIRM|nr:DNA polymerase III subunit delta [Neobittarella massiliensis]
MKYTPSTFKKALAAKELYGFCYLHGQQRYLIDAYAAAIIHALGAGEDDVAVIDGDQLDMEQLGDMAVTVSFAPVQVTVINGLSPEATSEADITRLGEIADYLSPQTTLIIKENFLPEGPRNKRAKAQKLRKLAQEKGVLVDVGQKDTRQNLTVAQALAKKEGVQIGQADLRYLLERCGGDLLKTQNELCKLGSYRLGEPVTRRDIDAFTPRTVELTSFEMARALLRGDVPQAMRLLEDLFSLREEPVSIIAALSTNFCDIFKVKVAGAAYMSASQIEKTFGYRPGDFRIKQAGQNGRGVSQQQIDAIIEALLQCDLALKSTTADPKILLQKLLVEISLLMRRH